MSEADDREQREVYYRGMVQGVGFRYTTLRIASRFSVVGYVQNLPDGRVLLVAEGPRGELDRFFGAVTAEMAGCIRDVTESTRPAGGNYTHFDVRY